ncbi:MAG: pilus assembly protein PilM [Candidatus Omnitrophota bacterium]
MKLIAGIEIGEHYIKILTSSQKSISPKISDCIIESIDSRNDEEIAKAIIDIFKKNRYRPESIAISLPRNFVTVRSLHLPSKDTEEISKMVELHISRVVPYKKEEVFFSYQMSGEDEMGYTKVLLAIVNKDIMRRPIKIVEKTGVLVDRILLSSDGVWQWVLKKCGESINSDDLYLSLDIDTTFTDFIIFDRNNFIFSRSIALKASELAEDLGRKRLLGEVRQSLLIFNNEEQNRKPAMIFLSGPYGDELGRIIEKELGTKVQSVPVPVSAERLKRKKRILPPDVSLLGAASLFLQNGKQGFPFELPEIQVRKSLRKKMKEMVFLGLFSIYFLSMVFFIFLGRMHHKQTYLDELKLRADKVEKELGQVVPQLDKIEIVKGVLESRRVPLYLMYQLQKAVPESIAISNISLDEENNIVLRGQAIQLSDVFDLATNLEKTRNFKDVQTRNTRKKKVKDQEVVDFDMRFFLEEYPG